MYYCVRGETRRYIIIQYVQKYAIFKYVRVNICSQCSLSANYIYRFEPGKTDPYVNRQCSIFTTMLRGCRALVMEQPSSPSAMNREGSDGDLHFENDSSPSVRFNVSAGRIA